MITMTETQFAKAWLGEVKGPKAPKRKPPVQTRAEIAKACELRREAILSILADGSSSKIGIVNATGFPATTIKDDLKSLVKSGHIHSTGKSRNTRWHLGQVAT